MTLQITSYGNGALLTKVIMGVSYIMANSNYLLLIQLVVILAGVVGLMVAHKENVAGGSVALKLIGTLAVAGVVWSSFYLPQDTVVIYDPVNNYQTSVKNVPVPLALPVYLENSIGDGLASLYDAYMGSSGFPSSLSYNNTGYNWGPVATQQLQNVTFNNPFDQMTVNSYLVNCYFPAVLMGHTSILDLYDSNNILQTLQGGANTSNAFLAEVFTTANPGGTYEDCNTTYNYLVGMVQTTTSTGSTAQSYAATVDGKTQATGLTLAQVTGDLGPAADFLLNTGLDSQQLIAQTALANSLNPAFQQFSAKYGVSAPNLSFGVAQTEYQQQTVWTQTAFMARIFLPILHFIMEAIIFGSFPLIFLMTLIPGFSGKAFSYIMSMLMWLTFWSPLMSILNGLSSWLISDYAFPLNVTGGNVNLNDMGYIFHSLHQWAAIIGSASMTVPMLAYGLATMSSFVGAETVMGITGAISGGINTAAQSVATESGAQSMQGQAQNMMQNNANKAYNDPSQFDGMMNNNAIGAAAHQQAVSSFIKQRGMNNAATADLAGQNYAYGQNSTMGGNAESLGQFKSEQSIAQNRAVQDLANQYFGGSRQNELSTVSAIDENKKLGGAEGSLQAYNTAVKKGDFKGSLEEFEQFKSDYQSKVGFAGAVGGTEAGAATGKGVMGNAVTTQREDTIKNLLGAQAFQSIVKKYGTGWIQNGTEFNEVERLASGNYLGQNAAQVGETGAAMKVGQAKGMGSPQNAQYAARVNAVESYVAAKTVGPDAAYAGYAKGVNEMNNVFTAFLASKPGSEGYNQLRGATIGFLYNSNPVVSHLATFLYAQDVGKFTQDQTLTKNEIAKAKLAKTENGYKSETKIGVKAGVNAGLSADGKGQSIGEAVGIVAGGILGSLASGAVDVGTEGVGVVTNPAIITGASAVGANIGGDIGGFVQHTWDFYTGNGRTNTNTNTNAVTTTTGNTTTEKIVNIFNNNNSSVNNVDMGWNLAHEKSGNNPASPHKPKMPKTPKKSN